MEPLNLDDLEPEDARRVKDLFDFLKARPTTPTTPRRGVMYRAWPLGAKGLITRERIHDVDTD